MPPSASVESSSLWCGDVDTAPCQHHRHHDRSRSRHRRSDVSASQECNDSEDSNLLGIAAAELEAMRTPPPSSSSSSSSSSTSSSSSSSSISRSFPLGCLTLLSSLPGNHRCVDCNSPASVDCSWAAASYGAVLCLACSGRHRGLGVRTSFVKSLTMDDWTRAEVLAMLEGGNAQLASFFDRHKMGRDDPLLARPSSNIPPPSNRYETKAAHFYRRHLAKHAAELAGEAGCYRGREASRAGSKESKDSKQAASDSESGSPDRLRRMTRRR